MTAPPADQIPSAPSPAPSPPVRQVSAPSLALVTVSVGAGLWTVYFAALIAVYATAYHRGVISCQAAAGWGLAIAFAAALLAGPVTVSWLAAGGPALGPVPRPLTVAAGAVVVLGSVAVIWVAVNLTLAQNTVGPWMLALVAAAAPIAVLLTQLLAPSVGTDAMGAGTLGTETDAPAVSGAAVAILEREATVVANPLLVADWAGRLGGRPPRVAVDQGMWDVVLDALGDRSLEVGGVALTVRVPGTLIVLGLVLPPQVQASGTFCEFRGEELGRVRDVIDGVSDILGLKPGQVVITWVHTHPGLGLFLSGTDVATAATWRAFDPEFTPIVIDPLAQGVSGQIGVFDGANRKIKSVKLVPGLIDVHAAGQLADELVDAYRGAKGTMVLFGAS